MPVRKIRKRYILFELKTSGGLPLTKREVAEMLELDTGSGKDGGGPSKTSLLIFEPSLGLGIIRTTHTMLEGVKLLLASIQRQGQRPEIEVITVSGTIRGLKTRVAASKARRASLM